MIEWTQGERLRTWRERRGLPVARAAQLFGVSSDTWYHWEKGSRPITSGSAARRAASTAPTGAEVLALLRRREGWTQASLARRLRVSRATIVAWEKGEGDWARLGAYWVKRLRRRGIV